MQRREEAAENTDLTEVEIARIAIGGHVGAYECGTVAQCEGEAMGGKRMTIPAGVAAHVEAEMRSASIARRRFRHREHMKEWRANPKHRETERKKRFHEYVIKKQRSAERLRLRPYTGVHGQPLCGFCGLGRPVEIVERLRISETAEEEYVRVLVPYCGHC